MEKLDLEQAVDGIYERSDARIHEIFNRIADLAIRAVTEEEGVSQTPPL